MNVAIEVVGHADLSDAQIGGLRALFDREYLAEFGWWNPERPYGYSPAAFHVIATEGERAVGHVGFQPRTLSVGSKDVLVGGTGGVLVAPEFRGSGLGVRLMHEARACMRTQAKVEFGYLGCREEVVPFYRAAGFTRIAARERCVSREDGTSVTSDGDPIMICPATRQVREWPEGDIDLRGTPW